MALNTIQSITDCCHKIGRDNNSLSIIDAEKEVVADDRWDTAQTTCSLLTLSQTSPGFYMSAVQVF